MGASAGLDKGEVTDRVINVVKNFNKVDPAKVRRPPAQTERLPYLVQPSSPKITPIHPSVERLPSIH